MRIYEGSARQDYEEVFRSIGAYLDRRGMREILLVEVPDGFVVQGLIVSQTQAPAWSDQVGQQTKETLTFLDEDIARFMEESFARRKGRASVGEYTAGGYYEKALRVLGRYIDQQQPRDVFFLEQDGAFVIRLLTGTHAGARHALAEFTRDEIEKMIEQGRAFRGQPRPRQVASPPAGGQSAQRQP